MSSLDTIQANPSSVPSGPTTIDHAARRTNQGRFLLIAAIVLFAAFSALRICLATFPKTMDVTPDELRYIDLARSLFNNGTLVVRGDASDFQKILYPLSLFPAFFFNDTITQVKAIGALNSLYACSAVFPALLLAKRLFKNDKVIVACMVLTLLVPDICYSMSFMSESIYLPLALWLVWVLWKALDATGKSRFMWSFAGGVVCYVTYLGKEVAVAFAIAFVVMYAIMAIRKIENRRACVLALVSFLAGFLIPFAIMKLTLFSGLPNSYSAGQTSPDVLLDPRTLLYGVYALAVNATHLVVAFAFFPIVFVAFTYREMPKSEKRLFWLCAGTVLMGLLIVVYTISIREDIGREALRQHLRYVAPLFVPLLFLFMRQIAHADVEAIKRSPCRLAGLVGTTTAVIVMVCTLFGAANLQQGFDNAQLHIFRSLYDLFGTVGAQDWNAIGSPGATAGADSVLIAINPGVWLSRLLVAAFIGVGTIGLLSKHRRIAGTTIVAVIAIVMIGNNVANCQRDVVVYGISESQVEEIAGVDEYLAQLPDSSKVLIVTSLKQTDLDNLADTYIDDRRLIYHYVPADSLSSYLAGANAVGTGATEGAQSSTGQTAVNDAARPTVDYVLINSGQAAGLTISNAQLVDGVGGTDFLLYRIG